MTEKRSLVYSARVDEPKTWDTSLLDFVESNDNNNNNNNNSNSVNNNNHTSEPTDVFMPHKLDPSEGDDLNFNSEQPSSPVWNVAPLPPKTNPPKRSSKSEGTLPSINSPSESYTNRKKPKATEPTPTSPPIEFEDFVGLFSNEGKKEPETTKNIDLFANGEDMFGNFDADFTKAPDTIKRAATMSPTEISTKKPGHKRDDSSSSHEAEMSDAEFNRVQNMFHSDNNSNVLPPPRTARSNSQIQLGSKSARARKSEPVNNIPGQIKNDPIPERKVGVNLSKDGTNARVRSDIGSGTQTKSPEPPNSKKSNAQVREPQSPQSLQSPSLQLPQSPHSPQTPQSTQSPQEKKSSKYDCLPELRRGTALLKYGKQGYPHFRQFNLSQKNDELVWFSNKKKLEQSSIRIKDINEVLTGQHTKEFRRISWTTLEPASFSIWYDGHTRSLNLVAKSVDEMKMWVEALRALQEKARRGEDLSQLRALEVAVDFKDRNRPQSRKHSGNFLRSNETKEKEVDPLLYRRLVEDLKALSKAFVEVKELAQNEGVQKSHEGASINQILSELEERIEELKHEVVHTRSTKIAENDVWRTRIDMQALREKILVLVKENKKTKRRFSVF